MKRKVTIVLITLASVYLFLCGALYFLQDQFLFPGRDRDSADLQLPPNVAIDRLRTADGIGYRIAVGTPASEPRGVLLYFVGNGEDLSSGVHWAANYAAYGLKTLVTEYPGFGESSGEAGLDTILAAAEASAKKGREWADSMGKPLFVAGHSLGTFSATHLAAQGIGSRLVLVSPPTSIAELGRQRFWFLPVGALLRHKFDNLSPAKKIQIPTLVIHGDADSIVPIEMGRRIAGAIKTSRFHGVRGRGHNDLNLDRHGPLGGEIAKHLFD